MQLTVHDVATLLNVSDKTVYRWVKNGVLPGYRFQDQYRFNRSEILEWATSRRINISLESFDEPETSAQLMPNLAEALQTGGIIYRVEGDDRASVLRALTQALPLPEGADRDYVWKAFLVRESMATTAVGDGIAIPHIRGLLVHYITRPMITLCFTENPVDFGALDGNPVYALFALLSPSMRAHLDLMARLTFALRDPEFRRAIESRGLREEILSHARRVEAGFPKPSGVTPV